MSAEKSLKSTLILKLVWLSVILFFAMMLILAFQYTVGINQATELVGRLDAKQMVRQFNQNPNVNALDLTASKAYREWQYIPEIIRSAVGGELNLQNQTFIEGGYQFNGADYYFSILVYPNESGDSIYLVNQYPSADIEILVEDYIVMVMTYSFWTLLGFVVLLLLCVFFWGQQLRLPFVQMIQWAEQLGSKTPLKRKSYKYKEFNQLACKLEEAMVRIAQYNVREKEFLQHASHELRTPLAITQATLDTLLEQRPNDRQLMRIRQAMNNMEIISTSLLWLARESKEPLETSIVDLSAVCHTHCKELNYFIENKAITVEQAGSGEINENQSIVHILLANLIRNSFQHSEQGTIIISVAENSIVITNPYHANSTYGGFGLGLQLVERICQRQQWQFSIDQTSNSFKAQLVFANSNLHVS